MIDPAEEKVQAEDPEFHACARQVIDTLKAVHFLRKGTGHDQDCPDLSSVKLFTAFWLVQLGERNGTADVNEKIKEVLQMFGLSDKEVV